MNREELEERQLEIANRMKNIIWTVCGDYTLEAKPDVEAFLKSKYIALYDGIKQGAFAKYFEKENKQISAADGVSVTEHNTFDGDRRFSSYVPGADYRRHENIRRGLKRHDIIRGGTEGSLPQP